MKKYFFLLLILVLASTASAYYSQNGAWEGRTRIDHYGQEPTAGAIDTDYVSGGLHPVTADYNALFTGYIGAFDLENVTEEPDIGLTKLGFPDPVNSGSQLNYTIVVTNNGAGNATNVTVVETYPAGVVFHSASPPPDLGTNNTWSLGNLTPAQSVTINITVNVTLLSGTLNNTVNATYQNSTGGTLTAGASQSTTVLPSGAPLIQITKTGPASVQQGENFNYTITISNTGSTNASNVTINETYPAGTVFVGADPAPDIGDNYWELGNISAGNSTTIKIELTAPGTAGTITNTANATFQNATGALFTTGTTEQTNVRSEPSRRVTGGGGGGGGGGTPGLTGRTFTKDTNPYKAQVAKADKILFMVNTQVHQVMINNIAYGAVTLTVSSTPQRFTIRQGSSQPVDVNGDGRTDVTVHVDYIAQNQALLTLETTEQPAFRFPTPAPREEKAEPAREEPEILKDVKIEEVVLDERPAEKEEKISVDKGRFFLLGGMLLALLGGILLISRVGKGKKKPKPQKYLDAAEEYQKELDRIKRKYGL